jgi:hypothetical protein
LHLDKLSNNWVDSIFVSNKIGDLFNFLYIEIIKNRRLICCNFLSNKILEPSGMLLNQFVDKKKRLFHPLKESSCLCWFYFYLPSLYFLTLLFHIQPIGMRDFNIEIRICAKNDWITTLFKSHITCSNR